MDYGKTNGTLDKYGEKTMPKDGEPKRTSGYGSKNSPLGKYGNTDLPKEGFDKGPDRVKPEPTTGNKDSALSKY